MSEGGESSPAAAYARFRDRAASPVLANFADEYPFALDDYQLEACAHVEGGSGVLVAAPTGAGKTIVGEFAVHLALRQGRKCFYTTPIKALSNQKYADLAARHGADQVGLLTGDTSINSEAPVVVMTTEVLRNMIYARSTTLANLGYVVMDEVHYLADRFRGAVWEEVIIGLADSIQVVALSATVSNAEEFGEWLSEVRGAMAVVVSERRPVPLYQHVLVRHRLYDLFGDPDAAGRIDVNPALVKVAREEARLVRDDSRRPRGRSGQGKRRAGYGSGAYGGAAHSGAQTRAQRPVSRADMVEELDRARLLPAIVFIFSRAGCDAAVRQLVGSGIRLIGSAEQQAVAAVLARHVAGLSDADLHALDYEMFSEALSRGVAAHHAGMLPAFKECVEEVFVQGLIKVVFATETLALGINMPARSVVLEKLVKFNGDTHADITPGEYTQLTGRAGRRGIDVEGHAVVLWQPGLDPRAVAGLASRRTYPLRSSFAPTYNMAVNLIASVGRERARALLELSFAQFQSDRSVVGVARTLNRNTEGIADYWRAAVCELGDFEEYARLRAEVSAAESALARERREDRRAETQQILKALKPGDIVGVPAGKHRGWVVVIDPDGQSGDAPRPLVLTEDRQVRRVSLVDFPTPPAVAGRMRLGKHFNPREPASRRTAGAALRSRVTELGLGTPNRHRSAGSGTPEDIEELRAAIRQHPCHTCPERETHARWAERAIGLEAENTRIQQRLSHRRNTIAAHFDRLCLVLESLGYLDGATVTESGRMLARIYAELDLVAVECLRAGVFDGLTPAQLAAVLAAFVYEARRSDLSPKHPRTPDQLTDRALTQVRRIWREVSLVERDAKVPRGSEPDVGFGEVAYRWASGQSLTAVLRTTDMTAGDFVRWVRQVADFAAQVADAAGPGPLRDTARAAVRGLRRGVVVYSPDED